MPGSLPGPPLFVIGGNEEPGGATARDRARTRLGQSQDTGSSVPVLGLLFGPVKCVIVIISY